MKFILLFLLLTARLGWAERVALVIGNNKYTNLPESRQLLSPEFDADDVAAQLKKLGYRVIGDGPVKSASRDGMTTAIEQFATAAKGAEAALFYFSGHSIQIGEENYLMPSDTPKLTGISVLRSRSVILRDAVMVALEEAGVPIKIIILDCCRDNPFSSQIETAFAQVGKGMRTKSLGEITGFGPGFYLAFATSPGQSALDGNGRRNSPFTEAMLQTLKATPESASKDVDMFFRDVKANLHEDQVSWTNHSLKVSFSLAPGGMLATQASPFDTGVVGKVVSVKLPGDVELKLCYCPPGSFTMGSPSSERDRRDGEIDRRDNESQVHVRVTKGFWMAQTELTQAQWEALMGTTIQDFEEPKGVGATHPMQFVSWEDADHAITKLNTTVTLPAGWKFALPSDAQWEYACRAGTTTTFAFGNTLATRQANFGDSKLEESVPVASYPPNDWGLYDMHGNVWEWCGDRYENDIIASASAPKGANTGANHVVRGGSWFSAAAYCRAAYRGDGDAGYRDSSLGFRPALVPSSQDAQSLPSTSLTPLSVPSVPATGGKPLDGNIVEVNLPGNVVMSVLSLPTDLEGTVVELNSGTQAGQAYENGEGTTFRWCPPGDFWMGSSAAEMRTFARDGGTTDEETRHRVKLTKGFWMSQYEVTQGEWEAVMGRSLKDQAKLMLQDDTKYNIGGKMTTIRDLRGVKRDADPATLIAVESASYPIYFVNWEEAADYCQKLTGRERRSGKLPAGWQYALPTEAQWEYACRAGTESTIYSGALTIKGANNAPALDGIAWYGGNSSQNYTGKGWSTETWKEKQYPGGRAGPRSVGEKLPNEWGLYDMIGNVWEWTGDWYGNYGASASDPKGAKTGADRVFRGGSWNAGAARCRAAGRSGNVPDYRNDFLGFRPALVPSK